MHDQNTNTECKKIVYNTPTSWVTVACTHSLSAHSFWFQIPIIVVYTYTLIITNTHAQMSLIANKPGKKNTCVESKITILPQKNKNMLIMLNYTWIMCEMHYYVVGLHVNDTIMQHS